MGGIDPEELPGLEAAGAFEQGQEQADAAANVGDAGARAQAGDVLQMPEQQPEFRLVIPVVKSLLRGELLAFDHVHKFRR